MSFLVRKTKLVVWCAVTAACVVFSSNAVVLGFSENFTNEDYIDTGATDAEIDTGLGRVTMPFAVTPVWTETDGVTPGYDNVSVSAGSSELQIHFDKYDEPVFDSSGRPIVWWLDETEGPRKIYISRWNGTDWTGMDSVTPGHDTLMDDGGFGAGVGLVLASGDHPIVVWYNDYTGSDHAYLARWNGSAWAHMDGVTAGVEDMTPLIDEAVTTKIALDQSGYPIVLWRDIGAGPFALNVTRWNGTSWTKMDGSTAGYEVMSEPSADPRYLLVSGDDMPIIGWKSEADSSLHISTWNGTSWTGMDGVTAGSDLITSPAATAASFERVVTDASGNPMILFDQNFGSATKFSSFTRWNGTAWTRMDGVTAGSESMGTVSISEYTDLGVGPTGFPTIAQKTGGAGSSFRINRWDGASWNTMTLSTFFASAPRIFHDNEGLPVVTWAQTTVGPQDIRLIRWDGDAWVGADGQTAGASSVTTTGTANDPLPAMNTAGDIFVFWRDGTPGDMLLSRFPSPSFDPTAVVQSITINTPTTDTISTAMLSASEITPDTSFIEYELTNDGGVNWFSVSSGASHSFSTTGNDLRWRGTLHSGSTPILTSLTVAYATASLPTPASSGTTSGSLLTPEQLALLFATPTPSPSPVPGPHTPAEFGLSEGDLLSAYPSGDPDVYIVNELGFKRLFLNPVIFDFYGHLGGYSAVKTVTPSVRDAFPVSGLYRNCETNDQKVYAVEVTAEDQGTLHHVNLSGESAVSQDPAFFSKVFCINNNEFNWYPKSPVPYTSVSQLPVYRR